MTKVSRKEPISYSLFVETANSLKAEGGTPSVRLIGDRIGGSNSTLLGYLRQWRNELALVAAVEDDTISEALQQALFVEFGRKVKASREKLEADLQQEQAQGQESSQMLIEAENKIAELEEGLKDQQEQSAQTILALEKQVAASQERGSELAHQIEKLEAKLNESMVAQEAARIETAKAQLQLKRADQTLEKTEGQLRSLEEKLLEAREQVHRAQIKAAVAEASLQARQDKSKS